MSQIGTFYATLFGERFATIGVILTLALVIGIIGVIIERGRSRRRSRQTSADQFDSDAEIMSIIDPEADMRSEEARRRVTEFLTKVHSTTVDLAAQNTRGRVSLRVAADALGFPKPPAYSRRARMDRAFALMTRALRGNGHRIRRDGNVAFVAAN